MVTFLSHPSMLMDIWKVGICIRCKVELHQVWQVIIPKHSSDTEFQLLIGYFFQNVCSVVIRKYSQIKDFVQKGHISLFGLIFIFFRIKLIFGSLTHFDMKSIVP